MEESEALQDGKKYLRNDEGVEKSSLGASGGIMTMWDPLRWDIKVYLCANHWILTII